MSSKTKRKLLSILAATAICASVAGITIAQVRYRETELEWHTTSIGGKRVKVLIPYGWRTYDGEGGRGGEWVRIGPSPQFSWMSAWVRTRLSAEETPGEDDLTLGYYPHQLLSDGREHLFTWPSEKVKTFNAYRTIPRAWLCVSYSRKNHRIFDATHKRICGSLQLANTDHPPNK
jgi:hypothetical protein